MPPWHAAPPRNAGAAAGLGAAVSGRGAVAAGLPDGKNSCCAKAADESASDAVIAAIAIRIPEKGIGIKLTGWCKIYRHSE
jgi:hypothetical protein